MALKRDPKCASSDYSTSSDVFTKDKGIIVEIINFTLKLFML